MNKPRRFEAPAARAKASAFDVAVLRVALGGVAQLLVGLEVAVLVPADVSRRKAVVSKRGSRTSQPRTSASEGEFRCIAGAEQPHAPDPRPPQRRPGRIRDVAQGDRDRPGGQARLRCSSHCCHDITPRSPSGAMLYPARDGGLANPTRCFPRCGRLGERHRFGPACAPPGSPPAPPASTPSAACCASSAAPSPSTWNLIHRPSPATWG
jgi:hypothetical protein